MRLVPGEFLPRVCGAPGRLVTKEY
jgi:hypothetical protein